MKKFKICDNATFAFLHTFENFGAFVKVKKNISFAFMLLLIILLLVSFIGGVPLYNSVKVKSIARENIAVQMQSIKDDFDKNWEQKTQEEFSEAGERVVVLKAKNSQVAKSIIQDFKESGVFLVMVAILSFASAILLNIFSFEWLQFCFKSKKYISLLRNIWMMINMGLVAFLYLVAPYVLLIVLNVLAFHVGKVFGVTSLLLWIPGLWYLTVVFAALKLRFTQIILGEKETSIFALMKDVRGNVFRYILLYGIISAVFSFASSLLQYLLLPFLSAGLAFVGVAIFFIALYPLMVASMFVEATLSFAYYRAIISKDKKFLKK